MTTDKEKVIARGRALLEKKFQDEGDCGSCGWHAALYEHDVEDGDIEYALYKNKGILELSCVRKDGEGVYHRGAKIDISAALEEPAISDQETHVLTMSQFEKLHPPGSKIGGGDEEIRPTFDWKCNCCNLEFISTQENRTDDGTQNGGANCPRCKAGGQYTYRVPALVGVVPVALEYFKPPFKYEAIGQTIYCIGSDGHQSMALQVRGWGNLIGGAAEALPIEKAEHVQDEFGQWAADALNAAVKLLGR